MTSQDIEIHNDCLDKTPRVQEIKKKQTNGISLNYKASAFREHNQQSTDHLQRRNTTSIYIDMHLQLKTKINKVLK